MDPGYSDSVGLESMTRRPLGGVPYLLEASAISCGAYMPALGINGPPLCVLCLSIVTPFVLVSARGG